MRQFGNIAFRGKDIDFITENISFNAFHKFRCVKTFILQFKQFFKPANLLRHFIRLRFLRYTFFISPVSGDPKFGNLMHFMGTNLDFNWRAFWSYDRRMKRLIHVGFWHCNIIFKTSGHRFPFRMNRAKYRITIFNRIDNNPNRQQIINLVKLFFLIDHLAINRIDMLWSTVNFGINI